MKTLSLAALIAFHLITSQTAHAARDEAAALFAPETTNALDECIKILKPLQFKPGVAFWGGKMSRTCVEFISPGRGKFSQIEREELRKALQNAWANAAESDQNTIRKMLNRLTEAEEKSNAAEGIEVAS